MSQQQSTHLWFQIKQNAAFLWPSTDLLFLTCTPSTSNPNTNPHNTTPVTAPPIAETGVPKTPNTALPSRFLSKIVVVPRSFSDPRSIGSNERPLLATPYTHDPILTLHHILSTHVTSKLRTLNMLSTSPNTSPAFPSPIGQALTARAQDVAERLQHYYGNEPGFRRYETERGWRAETGRWTDERGMYPEWEDISERGGSVEPTLTFSNGERAVEEARWRAQVQGEDEEAVEGLRHGYNVGEEEGEAQTQRVFRFQGELVLEQVGVDRDGRSLYGDVEEDLRNLDTLAGATLFQRSRISLERLGERLDYRSDSEDASDNGARSDGAEPATSRPASVQATATSQLNDRRAAQQPTVSPYFTRPSTRGAAQQPMISPYFSLSNTARPLQQTSTTSYLQSSPTPPHLSPHLSQSSTTPRLRRTSPLIGSPRELYQEFSARHSTPYVLRENEIHAASTSPYLDSHASPVLPPSNLRSNAGLGIEVGSDSVQGVEPSPRLGAGLTPRNLESGFEDGGVARIWRAFAGTGRRDGGAGDGGDSSSGVVV